jgi:hypothetical protein
MYIGYNGTGGTNAHLRFYANGTTERMVIHASDGSVRINHLAGSGYRATYSTSNGTLTPHPVPQWQLVDFSDFQGGTEGWGTVSGTMTRASIANMGANSGNFIMYGPSGGTANPALQKFIDLTNYPHTQVKIIFNYWFIDSWDRTSTQRGQINISSDNVSFTNVWAKNWWTEMGANVVTQSYGDNYVNERAFFTHSANALYLRFTSIGLGLPSNDSSWGLDNIEVYVR